MQGTKNKNLTNLNEFLFDIFILKYHHNKFNQIKTCHCR